MEQKTQGHSNSAVRVWLAAVAALVFAIVIVGGATRLTESGLSITEWQPVSGVLPPLSDAAWKEEFAKYKTIPQYEALNAGMSLAQFKAIFWWEWSHRLLGRVIGIVFLLPLVWFWFSGRVTAALRNRLLIIFGLGAFQGAIGWWMVASGLADRIEVSQYRLAFHLTLAATIYAALVWTAQEQAPRETEPVPTRLRWSARVLLLLVLAQIYLGALVAGLRAGRIDNTWPLMEGRFVPEAAQLFFNTPWWRNFFENPLTAQFDHRMLAYGVTILALAHAVDAALARSRVVLPGALALAGAVVLQAALGVFTLLEQAPLALALMHQAMAMIVLTVTAGHAQAASVADERTTVRLHADPAELGAPAHS